MTSIAMSAFNPMKFAARLREAGVPERQAEAEAEILHEALAQQAKIVSELEVKVTALKENAKRDAELMATKGDIIAVRGDIALLEAKIAMARRDTIIWLGSMLIAGFSVVMVGLPRLIG